MAHRVYAGVRTGDVLLFSGWNVTQQLLRLVTRCEYTHVGIAVWLRTDDGPRLHSLEAGTWGVPCVLTGRDKKGARLCDVDLIMGHHTAMAYRRVEVVRDGQFYATLRAFMAEQVDRRYSRPWRVVALNGGLSDDAGSGEVFCSELCCAWLYRCGALPPALLAEYPPHRASPASFVHHSTVTSSLWGSVLGGSSVLGGGSVVGTGSVGVRDGAYEGGLEEGRIRVLIAEDLAESTRARDLSTLALFLLLCLYVTVALRRV
jgi:hypothetical protein